MPNKAFEPTADQRNTVRTMAIAGVQHDIIAQCVINPHREKPISLHTLLKYFKVELEYGAAKANAQVVAALYRSATGMPSGPQVAAAIFWCKTQLGWRETTNHEHSGSIDTGLVVIQEPIADQDEWHRKHSKKPEAAKRTLN